MKKTKFRAIRMVSGSRTSGSSRSHSFHHQSAEEKKNPAKALTRTPSYSSESSRSQVFEMKERIMRAQQRQQKMQQLEEPRSGFYVHTASNGLDDSISSLEASMRTTVESLGSFEKRRYPHSIKETKEDVNGNEAFVGPFSSPSTAEHAYDFLREFSDNEKMKHKKKKSSCNWFQRRRASATCNSSNGIDQGSKSRTTHSNVGKDTRRRRSSDCGITHGRPKNLTRVVNDNNWKDVYDNLVMSRR